MTIETLSRLWQVPLGILVAMVVGIIVVRALGRLRGNKGPTGIVFAPDPPEPVGGVTVGLPAGTATAAPSVAGVAGTVPGTARPAPATAPARAV
ncbi:MAG: hypothetical protein LBR19_02845, partial [Bifidobacteriaceae bacterium]|nr:hypothetical protein [Bifidobacteriaceae bacterium]